MKGFKTEKFFLVYRVIPLVFGVFILKSALHFLGFEFLSLSPLITSLVAANVFLLGFLIAGTLTYYKESEKLPGELSVSLESIAEEAHMLDPPKDVKMEAFRKQISDQLKGQKFQKEAQKWVADLTASAKIKYYVNY